MRLLKGISENRRTSCELLDRCVQGRKLRVQGDRHCESLDHLRGKNSIAAPKGGDAATPGGGSRRREGPGGGYLV